MSDHPSYEVAVVGGGPAGVTTALYTTRLGHRTALVEKDGGRHAAVSHVHNVPGVSEDVSGTQLATLAVEQLETYGADVYPDVVESVDREDGRFRLEAAHATLEADRVVFATGFSDRSPEVPGLEAFTGQGLHYCLHCDAYTLGDGPVFVLGHGESAAHVAMTLCNFSGDVDLLLDDREPAWDEGTARQVREHPLEVREREVVSAYADEAADERWLGGLEFADGTEREYLGGFAMYGTEYNADLAEELGCALTDEGAVDVGDDRETSVEGAYAVGDVTHGQNQTAIAIGDGARAGIAIHKDLRTFPRPVEDLEDGAGSESAAPACPDDLRARMRRLRGQETFPGLRDPTPGE